jgi:hypothetical protein
MSALVAAGAPPMSRRRRRRRAGEVAISAGAECIFRDGIDMVAVAMTVDEI